MWFARQLARMLARYTIFVPIPLTVAVWLISLARGSDFGDLWYKVLMGVAIVIVVFLVLGGSGGLDQRAWEAQMVGRLPGAGDRLQQVRAHIDVSPGFSANLGILSVYSALIAALGYALSH